MTDDPKMVLVQLGVSNPSHIKTRTVSYSACVDITRHSHVPHWFLLDNEYGRTMAGRMLIEGVNTTPIFVNHHDYYDLGNPVFQVIMAICNFSPGPRTIVKADQREFRHLIRFGPPAQCIDPHPSFKF